MAQALQWPRRSNGPSAPVAQNAPIAQALILGPDFCVNYVCRLILGPDFRPIVGPDFLVNYVCRLILGPDFLVNYIGFLILGPDFFVSYLGFSFSLAGEALTPGP